MIIYKLVCRTTGKEYIGCTTKTFAWRWTRHLRDAHTGKRKGSALHAAIRKYGDAAFEKTILYEAVDAREMLMVERAMIAEHNTLTPNGYNLTIGGRQATGWKMTDEMRARMSIAQKSYKRSQEHQDALNAAHRKRLTGSKQAAKLDARKVAGIKWHIGCGVVQSVIAKKYGVHQTTIACIAVGKTWKEVAAPQTWNEAIAIGVERI